MLEIKEVEKSYGPQKALDRISFQVEPGEIYGLVGTDGAGKTTICRIIAGIIKYDQGQILFDGDPLEKVRKKQPHLTGYLPDNHGVYEKLTVKEYLSYFASLNGISRKEVQRKSAELLDQMGLGEQAQKMATKLSKGERQKLGLSCCLLGEPKLLLLDEPLVELDGVSRTELVQILTEIADSKTSILISSRNLQDLSKFCDRIGILDAGRLVIQGTVEEIMKQTKISNPLLIQVSSQMEAAIEVLRQDSKVMRLTRQGQLLSVVYQGTEEEEAVLLARLIQKGVGITSFYREESDLTSLYAKITQRQES